MMVRHCLFLRQQCTGSSVLIRPMEDVLRLESLWGRSDGVVEGESSRNKHRRVFKYAVKNKPKHVPSADVSGA
jgi:hypothetical protein